MVQENKNIKKYSRLLAVELSEENITCVEIAISKGLTQITGGFKVEIPVFSDINKTIAVLKENLRTSGIKTRDAIFGLSMQYFRLFPVPIPASIPRSEVGQILIQEGNINTTSENFSFIPLMSTQRQEDILRFDVLGISIDKKLTDICSLIANKCSLNLTSVTPSFLALGVYLNNQNSLISTLWISQIKSEFVVWSGKEPIYEQLLLTYQLSSQIVETINFIESQIPGTKINTIYTCGPQSLNINLSELGYNIKSFALTENISDVGKVLQKISLPEIAQATSLAIGGTNYTTALLPNMLESTPTVAGLKIKPTGTISSPKGVGAYVGLAFFVLIISLLSMFFVKGILLPQAKSVISKSSSLLNQNQLTLSKVLSLKNSNTILNHKIDYISKLLDQRTPWSKIFKEIGDMAPKDLWIDKIDINEEKINIYGRALDINDVANYSINLNHSAKLVQNSQIIVLRKYEENGVHFAEFQISLSVKENAYKIIKDQEKKNEDEDFKPTAEEVKTVQPKVVTPKIEKVKIKRKF